MKAILLAGGLGTRLRPLTLETPKPVVPIFNRPFLCYQLDLVRQVPDIDEVILSLNYHPDRIEQVMAQSAPPGLAIRYLVEPEPLGTAGAVKYAERYLDGPVVVFNGDILTQIDLAAVVRLHRDRGARATIVLTPVENPAAYGLVETDPDGNVLAFREKPAPGEVTCRTINAGIYVLEPDTFGRIPPGANWSIERKYFPALVADGEQFVAHIAQGYWIDIGTPAKYLQVHRDIMEGRYTAPPFGGGPAGAPLVAGEALVEAGAIVEGPCFVDAECRLERGARVGPFSVLGRGCRVGAEAEVAGAILWPGTRLGEGAVVRDTILGRDCLVGRHACVNGATVLGGGSIVSDYSQVQR